MSEVERELYKLQKTCTVFVIQISMTPNNLVIVNTGRELSSMLNELTGQDNGQNDLKTVKGTQSVHTVRGVAEGVVI